MILEIVFVVWCFLCAFVADRWLERVPAPGALVYHVVMVSAIVVPAFALFFFS